MLMSASNLIITEMKASKVAFVLFSVICLVSSASADADEEKDNEAFEIDTDEIMRECNESHPIPIEFVKSLNESGSFPDETLKEPMCYVRCFLEKFGIMSEEGDFNKELTLMAFTSEENAKEQEDFGHTFDMCAAERDETCHCQMAYNFVKCVMEQVIEKKK